MYFSIKIMKKIAVRFRLNNPLYIYVYEFSSPPSYVNCNSLKKKSVKIFTT